MPAPATAMLLAGKPIYTGGTIADLSTPAGAAIVFTLALNFGPMPPIPLEAFGYGPGVLDIAGQPNLRARIGRSNS